MRKSRRQRTRRSPPPRARRSPRSRPRQPRRGPATWPPISARSSPDRGRAATGWLLRGRRRGLGFAVGASQRRGIRALRQARRDSDVAGYDAARQPEGLRDRVCPLECSARETVVNGRCVAKACPQGKVLSRDGRCLGRPAPPRATTAVTRLAPPHASPSREVARTQTRAGSTSRCFNFNGTQYCE